MRAVHIGVEDRAPDLEWIPAGGRLGAINHFAPGRPVWTADGVGLHDEEGDAVGAARYERGGDEENARRGATGRCTKARVSVEDECDPVRSIRRIGRK